MLQTDRKPGTRRSCFLAGQFGEVQPLAHTALEVERRMEAKEFLEDHTQASPRGRPRPIPLLISYKLRAPSGLDPLSWERLPKKPHTFGPLPSVNCLTHLKDTFCSRKNFLTQVQEFSDSSLMATLI